MVLPTYLRKTITPAEVNFQAESELVTILPRYLMKKIELIGVSNDDIIDRGHIRE